jgi:hypothetical protein
MLTLPHNHTHAHPLLCAFSENKKEEKMFGFMGLTEGCVDRLPKMDQNNEGMPVSGCLSVCL